MMNVGTVELHRAVLATTDYGLIPLRVHPRSSVVHKQPLSSGDARPGVNANLPY